MAPGKYFVQLITKDDTLESEAGILPDPRLKVSTEEFEKQSAFLNKIDKNVEEIHSSVNQMRKVKTQIESYNGLLKNNTDAKDLLEKGKVF